MYTRDKGMIPRLPRLAAKRGIREGTRFARVQRNIDETKRTGAVLQAVFRARKLRLRVSLRVHLTGKRVTFLPRSHLLDAYFSGIRERAGHVGHVSSCKRSVCLERDQRRGGTRSAALLELSNTFVPSFPRNLICIYIDIRTYMWYIRLEDLCVTLDTGGG